VLVARHDPRAAEPLLREALKIRQRALPPGHWRTAEAEGALGVCLEARAEREEAERLLLDSYRGFDSAPGWRSSQGREETLRQLVSLYDRWGKRNQAARYRALLASR